MFRNNVNRNNSRDPDLKWAKHTIRDIHQTIRITLKLYDFRMDESDRLYRARRKIRGSNKKKQVDGLEELRHVKQALDVNTKRKDTKWRDSMALKIDSLIDIDRFEFKPAGIEPPNSEYHSTKLHCVFAIKHDLRQKSMIVARGHIIDVPTDL